MEDIGGTPESTPVAAPAATEPSQPSFADALSGSTFTQADLDAKIAESQKAWQAEQAQKYGWVDQARLTPEQYQQQASAWQRAQTDPIGYGRELWDNARRDPQFAPQIQQILQRVAPAGPAQPTAPPTAPGPDLRVQNPDGTVTQMYSAERMAEYGQWLEAKLEGKFSEAVKPLQESHAQQQAREQAETARQQQTATAQRISGSVASQPHFEENKQEIAAAFERLIPVDGFQNDTDAAAALWQAYSTVVLGKVTAGKQTEALATHARLAAGGSARPTGGSPATPSKNTGSFADALRDRVGQTA